MTAFRTTLANLAIVPCFLLPLAVVERGDDMAIDRQADHRVASLDSAIANSTPSSAAGGMPVCVGN